ncbi:MAG TPA: SCO family protein [Thermoanaerobaculia bacterium]
MPTIVSIRPSRGTAVFALLTTLTLPAAALGQTPTPPPMEEHQHHEHHTPPADAPKIAEKGVKLDIPDIALVDQDGKPVRFYSDLVKGKVVVVNFIFTTCTTICPPMGATFGKLQSLLGDRAGRDVHMISVSVDPATDTPERMKAWGQKFNAGPGWTLVTGDREQVTQLLKALGAYTPSINDHSPLLLVGNDAQDRWTRAYGLAPPAKMVELIDKMVASPAHAHHEEGHP